MAPLSFRGHVKEAANLARNQAGKLSSPAIKMKRHR